MSGMHESAKMGKDEWCTPRWLVQRLGPFDLDPCAAIPTRRPWATAIKHYSLEDNGLNQTWHGRVWLNPPYGNQAKVWLERLKAHGDGLALVFARTDTEAFFEHIWDGADALLFLRGRLTFHHVDGRMALSNSGAASVLVAYDKNNTFGLNVRTLQNSRDIGFYVPLI